MIFTIVLIATLLLLMFGVTLFVRHTNRNTPVSPPARIADDCCGAHAVCERDTLLSTTDRVIYFDDEELDSLRGRDPESLSAEERSMVEEVFFSLREQDVAGWIRSIGLRGIEIPADIREQALLVIAERRENTLKTWEEARKEQAG